MLDDARDRPRRRDDERRLRADGHDRQGVRRDLRRLVRGHRRRRDRQGSRLQLRGRVGRGSPDSRGHARSRPCGRRRRGRDGLGAGLPDEDCCGRTGRRSTPAARRRSRSASRPSRSTTASTRSTCVEGRWPNGGGEVAIDEGVADDEGLKLGDRIGVAALGPAQEFKIVGIAKYGDLSSIGGATFAIFDVPTAQELLDKEGELDAVSAAAAERHDAGAADAADPVGARRRRHRANGRRGGRRAVERDRDVHDDHPLLPALVRRHRALRRRVRHLQHALDHGRTADARVRHPAHARRVPPAGAAVRDPRGARDRLRRLARRPVQRPRPRRSG